MPVKFLLQGLFLFAKYFLPMSTRKKSTLFPKFALLGSSTSGDIINIYPGEICTRHHFPGKYKNPNIYKGGRKMKKLKRVLAGGMCVFMVAGLFTGCNSNNSSTTEENSPVASPVTSESTSSAAVDHKTMEGTLTFWHFNANEAPNIEKAFKEEFPKVKFNMTVVPDKDSQYLNKITQAIRSGKGVPDVFSAESAMVKRLVEMEDAYADITEKTKEVSADMAKYTIDIGTDSNGVVRALSHQITPGGIGYKKTVAKKYLGTDNAEEIAAMLSSQEKILETAEKLKTASNGKVKLFPSWEEMEKLSLGGRSQGWVVDNKLTLDQKVLDLIDFSKTMRDKGYESGYNAFEPGWTSAIAADEEAMCWTIPTWGVPWIIGANDKKAENTGKWGICKGPFPYSWGGTWFGVYSKSQNTTLAWEFVKWWTSDKEHLKEWNKQTGDIPNSLSLLAECADSNEVDKIMGINLFKFYQSMVADVNGSLLTKYDDTIENAFKDVMKTYLAGNIKSKDEVLSQFKAKVKANLKEITVE
jgi:maltose-binding protein MalE